jgi:hypothetical protein
MESLAKDKRSSLFGLFVGDEGKSLKILTNSVNVLKLF